MWWPCVREFRLHASEWLVQVAKCCPQGCLFSIQEWLGTLFSSWLVVFEEALHDRGLRQFLAPGNATRATWEGGGQRATRAFGVSRHEPLRLIQEVVQSLRVRISFLGDLHRGDLHSQVVGEPDVSLAWPTGHIGASPHGISNAPEKGMALVKALGA